MYSEGARFDFVLPDNELTLQILFTCRLHGRLSSEQVEPLQKDIWARCADRRIGGFFLLSGQHLVGLFEGPEPVVVGQVDHLIRKHKVASVFVVREAALETREWTKWIGDVFCLNDLPDSERDRFEGLAQIVEIAVEADQRSGKGA